MKTKIQGLVAVALLAAAHAAPAVGAEIWAFNLRAPTNLRVFDSGDPAGIGNIFAATGYTTYAMDFNTSATTLYAIRNGSNDFGTIDLSTGDFATIVDTEIADSTIVTDLAIDPTDDAFYVSTASTLYRLEPLTGQVTEVGLFGTDLMIDLAIDVDGHMYGHDIGTDSLYSIDKSLGAATLIGSHGLPANFAQGMDFDFVTNTLYAAIYTGGGTGKFVSWNVADGSVNVLADTTPFNVEMELAVRAAAPRPVPEPGSLALLGLGLAGLGLSRRRKAT